MKFNKKNEFKEKKKAKPVLMARLQMSRNGLVDIEFNQKLFVPPFDELNNGKGGLYVSAFDDFAKKFNGRKMLSLTQVDVKRDICDFTFKVRSDVPP